MFFKQKDEYFNRQNAKYDLDKVSLFTKNQNPHFGQQLDMSLKRPPKIGQQLNQQTFGRAKTLQDSVSSSSDSSQPKKNTDKKKNTDRNQKKGIIYVLKYRPICI